jgi:hypothetical protein
MLEEFDESLLVNIPLKKPTLTNTNKRSITPPPRIRGFDVMSPKADSLQSKRLCYVNTSPFELKIQNERSEMTFMSFEPFRQEELYNSRKKRVLDISDGIIVPPLKF